MSFKVILEKIKNKEHFKDGNRFKTKQSENVLNVRKRWSYIQYFRKMPLVLRQCHWSE